MKAKLLCLTSLILATAVHAQTTNRWTNDVAGTWLWQTPENWSAGAPSAGQSCFITNTNSKTIRITGVGPGSSSTISNLVLSAPAGSTNTLQLDNFESPGVFYIRNCFTLTSGGEFVQNAATTRVEGVTLLPSFRIDGNVWLNGGWLITTNTSLTTYVGYSGAGQVTTSNALWSAYSAYIGYGYLTGSSGTLTVAGGTNSISGVFYVGRYANATGTLWVTGGVLTKPIGTVYLGDAGVGRLTVSNGLFNAGELVVGSGGGTGTVLVAGGTLNAGTLTIGNAYTSIASLTLAGGTVSSRYGTYVGVYGPGALWMSGGQLTATGGLSMAQYYPATVTISNGLLKARGLSCGYGSAAPGTITIAGGKMEIDLTMSLGVFLNTSTGTVWVTGGELCVTNLQNFIGSVGTGQITVSNALYRAGEVYVAYGGNGTLTLVGGTCPMNFMRLAASVNTTGTVWLTDSTVTAVGFPYVTSHIGFGGVGYLAVSNSTWHANRIVVGQGTSARGTLTIDGGEVVANATVTYGGLLIGLNGCRSTGVVAITSGNLYVTNDTHNCELEVRSGTLNIAGGYVQCDKIIITNACANFVRTGGTFVYYGGLILSAADTDGDGIINSYEIANGLDPLDPVNATKDTDGDGLTDLQEYLAGTSPTNNASAFRITGIVPEGDDLRITWSTAAGKTNALQHAAGDGGHYTNAFADIFIVTNTVGSVTNYLDVGGATNSPTRFYRVRLLQP